MAQVCPGLEGCVRIFTVYDTPLERAVANVKLAAPVVPEVVTVRLSPPLFCNTNPDPSSPVTVPPIVKVLPQVTWMLETLARAFPVAGLTTQFCLGVEGWVLTVTSKAPPVAMEVLKVNGPLVVTGRSSAPLSWRMRPLPLRPMTVPAM